MESVIAQAKAATVLELALVDVTVTVTDSHGDPVHGLARHDFTVKEDNKPQPIRSFEEFGVATPTTA